MESSHASEDPLIDLVAEGLDHLEAGGAAALETFLEAHPGEAQGICRRIRILTEKGLDPSQEGRVSVPEQLGDFSLESPIGQGGMGIVWSARQISLGREVALKVIRPDQLQLPGTRERFQREVETIARLEHPGIVPIYAVGEDQGIPFFAMERVRGASLSECLAALCASSENTPRTGPPTGAELRKLLPDDGSTDDQGRAFFDGSWTDVVARIAREVGEALEHAARRGVVHRDVKPSNVMLTRGGRVLLFDFGLSSSQGGAEITRTGSIVGSLGYMAPEVHAGNGEQDDARQDVYSLGVSLYELLCLGQAFPGTSAVEVLDSIRRGHATPLRDRARWVSRELAAVVEVAMDPDPARRYPSCGALARDLTNVLERRPIEARPPGTVLRMARWTQRHPVGAVLTTAALVVPTLLFAQEMRNSKTLGAKNEELEQRGVELRAAVIEQEAANSLALELLDKSVDIVDTMLVRVGDETLASIPGLGPVREELLEEAFRYQEWFLERAGEDPRLQARTVDVALAAADVQWWLKNMSEYRTSITRAVELSRALFEHSQTTKNLSRLTTALNEHARAEFSNDQADAAFERLAECKELLETPLGEELLYQRGINAMLEGKGRVRTGSAASGKELLRTAIEHLELYIRDLDPVDDADYESAAFALASANDQLGTIHQGDALQRGNEERATDIEAAYECFLRAAEVCEDAHDMDLDSPELRFRRARSLQSAFTVKANSTGDPIAYQASLQEAYDVMSELATEYPSVMTYLGDLGTFGSNLSTLKMMSGDVDGAIETSERAVQALERSVSLSPELDARSRSSYALTLINHGNFLLYGERPQSAWLGFFQRGLEEFSVCIAESPRDRMMRAQLTQGTLAAFGHFVRKGEEEAAADALAGCLESGLLEPEAVEEVQALAPLREHLRIKQLLED